MKNALLKAAVAVAAFTLVPAAAKAETLTFFGSGAWTNPALWYTLSGAAYTVANKVPTSDDDAIIGSGAVCDAGAGGLHSIMSLTILLTATLNNGQFDANSYTFAINSAPGQGSTLVVNGANFNVRSSGAMNFNVANVFINSSTITFRSGSFANVTIGPTFSGTTIFNEGSFVIQGGTAVTFAGNNNRFDNIGDIRGNGGTTQFNAGSANVTLNNQGTIRADSGTLVLNGNFIWAADDGDGSFYAVTDDAAINLAGAFVVPANKTYYFKGPGVVNTLGSLTVNGTLAIGVPASGPIIAGNGNRILAETAPAEPGNGVIAGQATISGGGVCKANPGSKVKVKTFSLDGVGIVTVEKNAAVRVEGPNNNGTDTVSLNDLHVTNSGSFNVNVRELDSHGAVFTNQADATVLIEAPTAIVGTGSPASTFTNFGSWTAKAGSSSNRPAGFSGITTNAASFINYNYFEVTGAGAMRIAQGEASGAVFKTPDGVDLRFVTNLYKLNGEVTFLGMGHAFLAEFGGFSIAPSTSVQLPFLQIDPNGTLDGAGDLTIITKFILNGGNVRGAGILSLGLECTVNIMGPNDLTIDQRTINNMGTATWSGTGLFAVSNGAVWNNFGTFDAQTDAAITGTAQNTPTWNNLAGSVFKKSAGTGTTTIGINFNNSGTVDLQSGTTNFFNFHQLDGSTLLNGGNFGTVNNTPIVFHAGHGGGNGSFTGDVTIDSIIGKIQTNIGPGFSPGKITINGNYTQKPDAVLNIEVAGLATPGVDYDQLVVTGTATLGGKLHLIDINGFSPGPNDTITPLTANAITGTFDSTNAQVNYGSSSLTVAALPNATAQLLNISTRLEVRTGADVLIGGFIVSGTDQKNVLVRGLGPSLPVIGPLADPTLELHDSSKNLFTNDNWKDTQQSAIEATTIPPTNELESAIVATLPANNAGYTAILADKNGATGIGLVEVYDLAQTANSKLANISTRGLVETGDNVMIGGLILGPDGTGSARVLVRGIGPTLANSGVTNPLADPTLELHDSNGGTVASNDNWKDTQQSEIEATTIPPTDNAESAIVHTLAPGKYTAILKGKNSATGVALVELYNLP